MDYNQKMKEQLARLAGKEKLLLHTCCAICAGGALAREFSYYGEKKRLTDFFDVTLFFYNPNMDTEAEYIKRANELKRLRGMFTVQDIIVADYEPNSFNRAIEGFEGDREGGFRCERCFRLRIEETARYAKHSGFDWFSTTLTVGPRKNPTGVNHVGLAAEQQYGLPFLCADLKKENGFLAANETAKQLEIYRQNYCGCQYSKG